jgi:Zn-dependent protease with chaperone function
LSENPNKSQLNPFAFPTETEARFTLLVAAAFLFAVNIGWFMLYVFDTSEPNRVSTSAEAPLAEINPAGDFRQTLVTSLASAAQGLRSLSYLAVPVMTLLALAILLYYLYPYWLRRHRKLQPFLPDKDPTLHAELQSLADRAEISPLPTIEVGPGLRSQIGQMFGVRGRYTLSLEGGLRLLLRQAPDMFRAVILHELAHVANRDVGRTYFAQTLWLSTLFLALVVVGALSIQSDLWLSTFLLYAVQLGFLLAVITVIHASFLWVRQVYADWRTALLWGAETSLKDILERNAALEEKQPVILPWRLYPSAQERLAALGNPLGFFQLSWTLPLGVGLLLAFVVGGLVLFIPPLTLMLEALLDTFAAGLNYLLAQDSWQSSLSSLALVGLGILLLLAVTPILAALALIAGLGVAYLVSATLGLQIQRETVIEMVTGHPLRGEYKRLAAVAGLLVLGLELGFLAMPLARLSLLGPSAWRGGQASLLSTLLWLISAIVITWICLAYSRFFSQQVLGGYAGAFPPLWRPRLLALAFGALFGLSYLPLLLWRFQLLGLWTETILQLFLPGFLSLAFLVTGLMIALVFGATWTLLQMERRFNTRRCPSCGQPISQDYAVGHLCEQCDQNLAAWLLAGPPVALQA